MIDNVQSYSGMLYFCSFWLYKLNQKMKNNICKTLKLILESQKILPLVGENLDSLG